jgi:hypothetical protein
LKVEQKHVLLFWIPGSKKSKKPAFLPTPYQNCIIQSTFAFANVNCFD